MRTIETTAVVGPDHTITVRLPDDVPPGEMRVVVLFDAGPAAPPAAGLTDTWQMIDCGPWPQGFTASREQLYDDDGR